MTNLVAEVSRYLMILLIAIYTYYNFRFFSMKEEAGKERACRRQLICMYMLHFLAYLVIYVHTGLDELVLFYGMQVLFVTGYIAFYRHFYRYGSRILLNNTCMLLCIGFIILTRLNPERAMRQFSIAAASAVLTFVIPFLIDRVWQLVEIPWIYGGSGLILLLIVFLAGNTSYGAMLSLTIGDFSVQPSEFVKISFVFFVSAMFYRSTEFKNVVITTAVAAAHVLILVLSRDLGSALIFFVSYLMMLFAATSSWVYLGTGTAGGIAASAAACRLFSHVQRRVQAWRDPWSDVDNTGYQIAQSLFAIGTGGWFGMGLYRGMPEKIPVVDKDFIFAAVCEELGGIFGICLILICLGCFLRFIMIAMKMQAMFYKLIAFGLGTVYLTQVFLSIGGVIKFIPSTGVTVPFISYGGSSMVSTFLLFQVVQGLCILKRKEEEEDEKGKTESEGQ